MPTIAVLNKKGGSGKTTIATHLARAYQLQGHSVLLVDSDNTQLKLRLEPSNYSSNHKKIIPHSGQPYKPLLRSLAVPLKPFVHGIKST